jgi:hypothetical protein
LVWFCFVLFCFLFFCFFVFFCEVGRLAIIHKRILNQIYQFQK